MSGNIDDKIRKLLALAGGAASEAERATALHQAARLAEKYAVDLDALGAEASDFSAVDAASYRGKEPAWIGPVIRVLELHFNVRGFRRSQKIGKRVLGCTFELFGCRASRDVALYVFAVLKREFLRIRRELNPAGVRLVAFYRSVSIGLIDRLNELKQNATAEEKHAMILCSSKLQEAVSGIEVTGVIKVKPTQGSSQAYLAGRKIEINKGIRVNSLKRLEAQ